ncbi:MAG TPA: hypothetical protein VFO10_30590 [Oligoflexus sp.]|uniref:hypothetical protein n=1 Tax=Oligoflexus sp. TaxID=1971216 RepID=UPI002D80259A|nr:hypothetical protein [Oligoflexus sp.]HET9241655.1 hypothetical protein [Oligoflexus sp.]
MRFLNLLLFNTLLLSSPTFAQKNSENQYVSDVFAITSMVNETEDQFFGIWCPEIDATIRNVSTYAPQMQDKELRSRAEQRFLPFVKLIFRKSCRPYGAAGAFEDYERDSIAATPAGPYLSESALLQALVTFNKAEVDALVKTWNEERRQQGLGDVIAADYPNSVVGGISSLLFIPGWPGRPQLNQWVQVQRTLESMLFISLEPSGSGYASYLRASRLQPKKEKFLIEPGLSNLDANCFGCHYSGKPLRLPALDDPEQAARVKMINDARKLYPARTHHPIYNPPENIPGMGTSGTLTMERASLFAGRPVTADELTLLNQNTRCNSCHNGSFQNPIHDTIAGVITIYLHNGFMPPGLAKPLDDSSRQLVEKVLAASYRETLRDYFLPPVTSGDSPDQTPQQ